MRGVSELIYRLIGAIGLIGLDTISCFEPSVSTTRLVLLRELIVLRVGVQPGVALVSLTLVCMTVRSCSTGTGD
jgi:hypothetical protein